MFVIMTLVDVIRIPPESLSTPTKQAVHNEIDQKYPNRVVPDAGLVVCRYGDCLSVGPGVCVAGDGGSHHECAFRLVVFRPFVEEVCLGRVVRSTADGIQVSLGFFDDIFVPAYWMLRPSAYEETTGLWVWTPQYDDDEEEGDDEQQQDNGGSKKKCKIEHTDAAGSGDAPSENNNAADNDDDDDDDDNRYEMEVGSEIRFKVKSINFTKITSTVKGMQAVTSTTTTTPAMGTATSTGAPTAAGAAAAGSPPATGDGSMGAVPEISVSNGNNNSSPLSLQIAPTPAAVRRQRSSSMGQLKDLVDMTNSGGQLPSAMSIVASICEDGLGLTSWWASAEAAADDDEGDDDSKGINHEEPSEFRAI